MRLGDLDALFEEFERAAWYNNMDRDEIAEEILLRMPTIDAVPVVHCVNCVHFGAEASAFDAWTPYCLKHKLTVFPDDFCSYGERKDGEG